MKLIEFKKHKIELYDSAEVLPIKRYQRFNKYLMIDNEVGSTFADFDKRNLNIIELLKKDMKKEALLEFENRRQAVFNCFQDYSPKNLALAILVYSINGEIYSDYSEESLKRIIETLDKIGFTKHLMDDEISLVKKKFKINLKIILKAIDFLKKNLKSIRQLLRNSKSNAK